MPNFQVYQMSKDFHILKSTACAKVFRALKGSKLGPRAQKWKFWKNKKITLMYLPNLQMYQISKDLHNFLKYTACPKVKKHTDPNSTEVENFSLVYFP